MQSKTPKKSPEAAIIAQSIQIHELWNELHENLSAGSKLRDKLSAAKKKLCTAIASYKKTQRASNV